MFNSVALEVVIGLVFIYLLYSLLATTIQELLATWLKLRARMLQQGIKRMLDDGGTEKFSKEFYEHPLIKYFGRQATYVEKKLFRVEKILPSYLGAQNFSKVLTEIMTRDVTGADAGSKISNFISTQEKLVKDRPGQARVENETLQLLRSFADEAGNDAEKFKVLTEQWFDSMMERVSGWYKRKAQQWLLVIGFVIAAAFNVDTLMIVKKLSHDKDAARALADMASGYAKANKEASAGAGSADTLLSRATALLNNEINDANNVLGIGYNSASFTSENIKANFESGDFLLKIIGWLLTALAISLGAPFWFDLLNKLMKLRGSVKQDTTEGSAATNKDKAAPLTVNVNANEAIG